MRPELSTGSAPLPHLEIPCPKDLESILRAVHHLPVRMLVAFGLLLVDRPLHVDGGAIAHRQQQRVEMTPTGITDRGAVRRITVIVEIRVEAAPMTGNSGEALHPQVPQGNQYREKASDRPRRPYRTTMAPRSPHLLLDLLLPLTVRWFRPIPRSWTLIPPHHCRTPNTSLRLPSTKRGICVIPHHEEEGEVRTTVMDPSR